MLWSVNLSPVFFSACYVCLSADGCVQTPAINSKEARYMGYFSIRTNGPFPHCVIMQFLDIQKRQGTLQVFTCPGTANSPLSLTFPGGLSLCQERPLSQGNSSSLLICVLGAMTACHCLPAWMWLRQFADMDVGWSQDCRFMLCSLSLLPSWSPKSVWPGIRVCKGWSLPGVFCDTG